MKTTIIGAGKIGKEIATRLIQAGHDLVVIDNNEVTLQKIEEDFDCLSIKGSGSTGRILKSPEVVNSDLLIAVTNSDEVNMVACMTAKQLGIPHTVARIRDPDYAPNLVICKDRLGIDLVVNPEFASAVEINRYLTMDLPVHMQPFAKGQIKLVDISINKDMSMFAEQKIEDLTIPKSVLIVAISRDGNMIIPNGQSRLMPGDTIYMLGHSETIDKICAKLKKPQPKVQKVMILGGGRITYYLAEMICKQGMKVKIIEQDSVRCKELAEKLPDEAFVLCADGSDIDLLEDEGVKNIDAFVAATGIDEENLTLALLAKKMGSTRVIAKISRPSYAPLVEQLGVDYAISPRLITASEILRYLKGGRLLSISLLLNGKAEVLEMIVQAGSKIIGRPLHKAGLPPGVIFGAITRNNKVIIPQGNDVIQTNDRLVVFTLEDNVNKIESMCGVGGVQFE